MAAVCWWCAFRISERFVVYISPRSSPACGAASSASRNRGAAASRVEGGLLVYLGWPGYENRSQELRARKNGGYRFALAKSGVDVGYRRDYPFEFRQTPAGPARFWGAVELDANSIDWAFETMYKAPALAFLGNMDRSSDVMDLCEGFLGEFPTFSSPVPLREPLLHKFVKSSLTSDWIVGSVYGTLGSDDTTIELWYDKSHWPQLDGSIRDCMLRA